MLLEGKSPCILMEKNISLGRIDKVLVLTCDSVARKRAQHGDFLANIPKGLSLCRNASAFCAHGDKSKDILSILIYSSVSREWTHAGNSAVGSSKNDVFVHAITLCSDVKTLAAGLTKAGRILVTSKHSHVIQEPKHGLVLVTLCGE